MCVRESVSVYLYTRACVCARVCVRVCTVGAQTCLEKGKDGSEVCVFTPLVKFVSLHHCLPCLAGKV